MIRDRRASGADVLSQAGRRCCLRRTVAAPKADGAVKGTIAAIPFT